MLAPGKRLSQVGNRERKTFHFETILLTPGSYEDFVLDTGKSAIVQRLRVSGECLVQVFASEDHSPVIDPTPYTFKAVPGSLVEDGSTKMTDGTVFKTRQYSIFVNLETPTKPQVYARITNTQAVSTKITLDLIYLTVED